MIIIMPNYNELHNVNGGSFYLLNYSYLPGTLLSPLWVMADLILATTLGCRFFLLHFGLEK